MAYDKKYDGKRSENPMRGAARRTYPGPRVGTVRGDVPRAERVGGESGEKRPYPGNRETPSERRAYGNDFRNRGDRPERRPEREKRAYGGDRETAYEKRAYGGERESAPEKRPYGGGKYYSGDPKRRREDERRRDALPARKLEPEETLAALEADPEQIICGRNPIREALRAGRPIEKLLAAGELSGSAREIVKLAKDAGAVVQIVDRARLDQIYPAHQGLLAYVAAVKYSSVDEMLALAKEKGEDPFLILLDGITDPHNLGAIIRSAECAGAHGVIIPERRASGLTATVAKAAAGALESMKIARVTNLNRTIDELKEKGIWIIGTAMDGENAFEADLTGPAALVIGSEGEGISRLTMEKCNRRLTLPMKGKIESLNASVAAGVLMYAVLRARESK
ncbi:MAG: 23S rRNA (guanosine(2251)-2'-O)-methyltransferase RlmB [Candidatus Faecivicinus sp.]|nr:23S rRNA (guanosine(2251)-2'-O)-methyltransferase RlmB [Candidatus Faecivicinus sp.]